MLPVSRNSFSGEDNTQRSERGERLQHFSFVLPTLFFFPSQHQQCSEPDIHMALKWSHRPGFQAGLIRRRHTVTSVWGDALKLSFIPIMRSGGLCVIIHQRKPASFTLVIMSLHVWENRDVCHQRQIRGIRHVRKNVRVRCFPCKYIISLMYHCFGSGTYCDLFPSLLAWIIHVMNTGVQLGLNSSLWTRLIVRLQ